MSHAFTAPGLNKLRSIAALAALTLSACGQDAEPVQGQRIALDQARHVAGTIVPSPDTTNAVWTVSPNGRQISFAIPGGPPMMTLACRLRDDPVRLAIIRHVPSRPGLSALFPVIGNGTISRFPLDAKLADGEWRWEGALPASDPLNDVFTGAGKLEATLPGGGSLAIGASRIPGEFVNWCRAGGRLQRAQNPA